MPITITYNSTANRSTFEGEIRSGTDHRADAAYGRTVRYGQKIANGVPRWHRRRQVEIRVRTADVAFEHLDDVLFLEFQKCCLHDR